MANEKNLLAELHEFKDHLERTVHQHLAVLDEVGEYDERFDITVSINGKSVEIPLHADSYNNLDTFINNVIDEEGE